MASSQRHNSLFLLVVFCLTFVLAACSSGGGKGNPPPSSDTTPDAFTLTAPTGVDLTKVAFSTPIVSSPATISGITAAANASISGGEFALAGGAFASTARTVTNGQTITVRVQSPVKAGQSATATLNVGGQTAAFTVTTDVDTTPPEVAILFPPPASMTEGQTLFLRGTVKDVHGTLQEGDVTVNGVAADLELNGAADEGTWSVALDLAMGENALNVTAVDVAENTNNEESVTSRRVADITGESFPDNQNPFGASINADIGWVDGKPVAYVADDTALKVFSVDLTTGVRTVLAENEGVAEELVFEEPWGIHLGVNGKLYVSDLTKGAMFEVDPGTGLRTLVAASSEESFWSSPTGMLLRIEQNQERLYVADLSGKVFFIDLATREPTLVVNSRDGLQPGGEIYSAAFGLGYHSGEEAIVVAAHGGIFQIHPGGEQSPFFDVVAKRISSVTSSGDDNKIYFVNGSEDSVYSLDTEIMQGTAVAGMAINGTENQPVDLWGVAGSQDLDYLLMVDRQNGLIAMDHVSKHRVVVSKSVSSE
jgi:hypothetical protein